MSVRVDLPDAQGVTGGVEFVDGVATVDRLSPNAHAFFEHLGATITGEADDPIAVSGDGRELHAMTVPELREVAATDGIDVPAGAKKADIIEAITAAATSEG